MTDKIAAVIDSFDEEGRQPANYVVELALGTCESCGEATKAVRAQNDARYSFASRRTSGRSDLGSSRAR